MPDPITLIALGATIGALGGCYLYWKAGERDWERERAERAEQIQEGEDAYYAAKKLAQQRRCRVPLAERIKDMQFTTVTSRSLGYSFDDE